VLTELTVENLLLIERAHLRLGGGLNVLTGETGAGKTVLAHALDLLLGGRPRAGVVRPGAREAHVEGAFLIRRDALADLPAELVRELDGEREPVEGEGEQAEGEGETVEIVLGRRVSADGRTRAYLNGRTATVADLRELGGRLIAFYGQHEHRKLTFASAQLQILDDFCGPQQAERRAACAAALTKLRDAESEMERLKDLSAARERELDLLEHELGEIEQVDPQPGDRERLAGERERLRRIDALRGAAALGSAALAGDEVEIAGAVQSIAAASARIEALTGLDRRLDSLGQRMRALSLEADDLATELGSYAQDLDAEEGALESVEDRLSALDRLIRKHGGSEQAVIEYGAAAAARRAQLLGAEVAAAEASAERERASAQLDRCVQALRAARRRAAPRLAKAVREQLQTLAMADASFEVALGEREVSASGADTVELMLAPNPGVAAAPLRESASGGELSRTMLALMSVANASEPHLTLVFDEVDAGIGGHTARAVGERLRTLASGRQVICITHLPQIASLASAHFTVVKDTDADPTLAQVLELADGEVVGEIVRMLGASDRDAAARRHAQELLKAA